jgi:hypothetical protein
MYEGIGRMKVRCIDEFQTLCRVESKGDHPLWHITWIMHPGVVKYVQLSGTVLATSISFSNPYSLLTPLYSTSESPLSRSDKSIRSRI